MTKTNYYVFLLLGASIVLAVHQFFGSQKILFICYVSMFLYVQILNYLRARYLKMTFIDFLWSSIPILGAKEASRIVGE